MLEQSERFERVTAFGTAFAPIPCSVAGGLMAAVAVSWMIAPAPALNVATISSGWAGEVALAVASLAAAIMLVAAVGLAAVDWRTETKVRGDWGAIGKMANVMPAPVGAPVPRDEVYAPAVYDDALCSLFRAHRLVRSPVNTDGNLGAVRAVGRTSGDRDAITEPQTIGMTGEPAVNAITLARAGTLDRTKHDLQRAPHARAPSVLATQRRDQRHVSVRRATRVRLVVNARPWEAWSDSDQRPTLPGLPTKFVSNIIVLGNQRPTDGGRLPSAKPSDSIFTAGSNGGHHPRGRINSLQPEVSFEAKRQLIALAEALARQAAREEEAAEPLAERSRSPPDVPAEISPGVTSAVEAYQKERKRLAEERRRSRHKLENTAAEVERKISRLLTLVENGHADPVATGPRVNELLAERKQRADALRQQPASNVIEFFPEAAERYRQKVADIHAALSGGEQGDHEAVALVRALIGRIVVHATPAPEPLGLEVEGSLAALMSDAPQLEHSGISCCMSPQPIFLYLNQTLAEGVPTGRTAAPMGCGTPVVRKACRRDAATEQGVSSERRDALSLK